MDDQTLNMLRGKLILNQLDVDNKRLIVYAMAGIPGAGKTTFVNKMLVNGQFPKNAYVLSPDYVMELLPGYKEDFQQLGKEEAFNRWEIPARSIAYELMEEAVNLHMEIIQDIGNSRLENFKTLKNLKEKHNYYLKMYWLEVPIDLALERIKKRERFTPEEAVSQRLESLSKMKMRYKRLVDEFIENP